MADNTSLASKSAMQAAFPASTSLPSLLVATSSHHVSPFSVSRPTQPPQTLSTGGGMRLEAVMENLQRQQAARLAMEEKLRQEKDRELRCLVESRIQQQALAIRHYQAAVRAAAAAAVTTPSISNTTNSTPTTTSSSSTLSQNRTSLIFPRTPVQKSEDEDSKHKSEGEDVDFDDDDMDDEEGEEEEEHMEMNSNVPPGSPTKGLSRVNQSQLPNTSSQSHSLSPNGQSGHHEWTYEEQFKQLYELDEDPKRKEFLDDLFSFMQKRESHLILVMCGTPPRPGAVRTDDAMRTDGAVRTDDAMWTDGAVRLEVCSVASTTPNQSSAPGAPERHSMAAEVGQPAPRTLRPPMESLCKMSGVRSRRCRGKLRKFQRTKCVLSCL
ncbi:PREDICTED: AT-rich interactive domain-containing protein 3A-like [Nanorana parkeri]|uniref:AT-rich interactive domain-containing protein 3A-like n=1 Tax=Nanorana parkeri TaxID=125878 RepID=UPI0008545C5D|nr:PREDICTED: AT-rich interactive domain-containing protein 3A-like [Nanorana parkeri]